MFSNYQTNSFDPFLTIKETPREGNRVRGRHDSGGYQSIAEGLYTKKVKGFHKICVHTFIKRNAAVVH